MLQKFDMIRQYLFGNEEETNVDRFDMAWDINEHFWKLAMHIKLNLADSITASLTDRLGSDWEVCNSVPDEFWTKGMAGIYIAKNTWRQQSDFLRMGIQAQAQEFNRLCLCISLPAQAFSIVKDGLCKDFLLQATPAHTECYQWFDDSFYGEANSKDFHKILLTAQGMEKATRFYVTALMDFKARYEGIPDQAALTQAKHA